MAKSIITHGRKRFLSPSYLANKIREHGYRNSLGILRIRILPKLYGLIKGKMLDVYFAPFIRITKQNNILYAFYDLRTSALDFGVVIFLSIAEQERIRLGEKILCLVVVPETDNYIQIRANKKIAERDNMTEQDVQEEMGWRLRNIIIPSISSLAPHCQIKVFSSKKPHRASNPHREQFNT